MQLSTLGKGIQAVVAAVHDHGPQDLIARRLRDLGFVAGEPVSVVAHGPLGGEPMVVQIGFTRFALRRAEAARVMLIPPVAQGA